MHITFDRLYAFTVEQGDAHGFIGSHLAYPRAHRWEPIAGVGFWTGQQSYKRWDLNPVAGAVYVELVRAVADGRYAADEQERVAAGINRVGSPCFYGPCLIAGIGDQGEATPLPDAFWSWWEGSAPDLHRIILAHRIADTLAEVGVTADQVTEVTVLSD
ncbi:hypothetical protein [Actinokineospora enzanensis]|uniref:hypothetical protein n=1 Tax=Actinokineospora enzanensis TaxID=155975 RepID=UPI00035E3414|nr:hypothetical protein [Actinokineospora enzanensis]